MEGIERMRHARHVRYAVTITALWIALLGWAAAGAEEADAAAGKAPAETPRADAAAEKAAPALAGATQTTASGLEITTLREGTGASPKPRDRVVVHYHGTFEDGKVFDSSVDRGKPASFPLNRVIRCWTEGLQLMKVGGKARLVCPPKIAYGARGKPPRIPPNATLTFEVELLEIK
jgi:FKBP-type peptidyl-prolyl cis-trans isomerase